MNRPSDLPTINLDPLGVCRNPNTVLAMHCLRIAGVVSFVCLLIFALGGLSIGSIAYYRGFNSGVVAAKEAAIFKARAEVYSEMRQACPAWFTDSRSRKPGAVVACTMPDWMRR